MGGSKTAHLYERYYFSKPGYTGGTKPFHDECAAKIKPGTDILEIGAGSTNMTTDFLASIGRVTGLDVDPAVSTNRGLAKSEVFDGGRFPLPDNSFDSCVSNWVLEHVPEPELHFREVCRVLRPGGVYCFRTPNLFHYVTLGSHLLPHSLHLRFANKLRALEDDAHDPFPTVYRANTKPKLARLLEAANFSQWDIRTVEPEPSYGRAHPALFYPMMAYERIVNSTDSLKNLRIILLGAVQKAA